MWLSSSSMLMVYSCPLVDSIEEPPSAPSVDAATLPSPFTAHTFRDSSLASGLVDRLSRTKSTNSSASAGCS